MITTLLWDVDGVFVDTEELHYQAWLWLAKKFNKTLSPKEYISMKGRGSDENMQLFCKAKGISEDTDKLQSIRRKKYMVLRDVGIPIIKENIALARRFKKEYPKLCHVAVSSSKRAFLEENLSIAGLSDFFVRTISYEDGEGMKRKPSPDIYHHACKISNCAPSECVAFEDSINGIAAARAAGIKTIILPTLLSPQEILQVYK